MALPGGAEVHAGRSPARPPQRGTALVPARLWSSAGGLGELREGRGPAFGLEATSRWGVPSPWQCSAWWSHHSSGMRWKAEEEQRDQFMQGEEVKVGTLWSWCDAASPCPWSFPSGPATGGSCPAASVGAWATSACSRTWKCCRGMAGTPWRSSGTPRPWSSERGQPCGPAPVALGSLAEPHAPGVRRREPRGGDTAGQGDIKSPDPHGCPGTMQAPHSLLVAPPALSPPPPVCREVTERDLLEAGLLSPSHPWLIHDKLGEGSAVSLPRRPDLGPSA